MNMKLLANIVGATAITLVTGLVSAAECGGTGINSTCTVPEGGVDTALFIQEEFDFIPSNYVTTTYTNNTDNVTVSSTSARGTENRSFVGDSDGGAITASDSGGGS